MTAKTDTTLRDRPEQSARIHRQLVGVCVASVPLAVARRFDLPQRSFELGRASGPEVLEFAQDPRVSRRHALIAPDASGRPLISPIGDATVEVNGEAVGAPRLLDDGDVVLLGESALVLRESLTPFEPSTADDGILGTSPTMISLRRAVAKVGKTGVTVLLLGESGTGKEVVARALHRRSGRKGEFVAVNCAAIPASLAEAQLFGHVAGAFTGAQKASAGLFRAAHGGTLFLDELGDLPLDLQPKLLRVLEERSVAPLGATGATPTDVRVVTATHRDLFEDVQSGRFRGDLYARIAEYVVHLPPLRARREDVLLLLAHLHGGPLPPLTFGLIRALLVHPWPFNVRELRSAATQLKLAAADHEGPLTTGVIELRPLTAKSVEPTAPSESRPKADEQRAKVDEPRGPPNRAALEELLRTHQGNVAELARSQGRSRKQVYRWLESLALDPEAYRER